MSLDRTTCTNVGEQAPRIWSASAPGVATSKLCAPRLSLAQGDSLIPSRVASCYASPKMAATGTEPYARLREELCAVGFDVFQPMSAKWYNDYLKALDLATDSAPPFHLQHMFPCPGYRRGDRRRPTLNGKFVQCGNKRLITAPN